METLLVPLDFSDATPKVVSTAANFAELLKARLVLLHVVEPRDECVPLAATDIFAMPEGATHPLNPNAFADQLERFAEPLRQQNHLEVACKVQAGVAADEILSQACTYKCGMIILGSHGHGALYHLFTGGVAAGVLKKAQSPVLIVPVRDRTPLESEKCVETSAR